MDSTFLNERITQTKATIIAYETAIDAIILGGAESYTLDTGQTRQVVTKLDIADMQMTLDSLLNRLTMLQKRLTKSGMVVRPNF